MRMKRTPFFIFALLSVIALGFAGYYFGFLGFVYTIMMPQEFGQYGLVLLSVFFGIAAFFSPCAFTVLPAYVAHYLSGEEHARPERAHRSLTTTILPSLYFGALAALGIIVVNLVVGLIIALLGSATPFTKDPREDIAIVLGVRIIAGFAIAILGVLTITGVTIRIPGINRLLGPNTFGKSIFAYGIMYNAAAIGCTGPIMLGLMLYAFAQGSFVGAITAFLWFSITMGALMVLTTLLIGLFKAPLVQYLARAIPMIKTIAGIVMIIVGLTVAFLTIEGNRIFVDIFFPFLK